MVITIRTFPVNTRHPHFGFILMAGDALFVLKIRKKNKRYENLSLGKKKFIKYITVMHYGTVHMVNDLILYY